MKVAELIRMLKNERQDAEVYVYDMETTLKKADKIAVNYDRNNPKVNPDGEKVDSPWLIVD